MLSNTIYKSILDRFGKESHTRISSYIILILIVITNITYNIIEIINANTVWNKGEIYVIPTEHVFILTLFLGHHLVLLGIKKASEKNDIDILNKSNENKPIDEQPIEEVK